MKSVLIYGAYGFSGRLISDLCKYRNIKVVLSGRDQEKLYKQAEMASLPYVELDLKDTDKLVEELKKHELVIHCAGPFIHTALPMMNACLKAKTHYIDITGEIKVFELAATKSAEFEKEGLMLMPGTGFDVVPTDCLALWLKEKMPDANELTLAFRMSGTFTRGTATTMVEHIGEGGAIRKDGKITRVPSAWKSMVVDFGVGAPRRVTTIPWGDVSTAWYSTGIPNISVYATMPRRMLLIGRYFGKILSMPFFNNLMKQRIQRMSAGPTPAQREKGRTLVWGQVKNKTGETKTAMLQTPEGYTLTAETSVLIAKKILEGNFKPGFQTPAKVYGPELIMEVGGVTRKEVLVS